MTAEQVLQEAIIDLQKREMGVDTRHLVEEAAQLLGEGRDIEARALVEKAQAITSTGFRPKAPEVPDRLEPATVARISARLTQAIGAAFNQALGDLHGIVGAQVSEVAGPLESRLADLAAQVRAMSPLQQRVERIERDEPVHAKSISSLEETTRALRVEFTAQQERLSEIERAVAELAPRLSTALEQIDHTTNSLRSMNERQAHRAAALNDVLDVIARLREPKPASSAATP